MQSQNEGFPGSEELTVTEKGTRISPIRDSTPRETTQGPELSFRALSERLNCSSDAVADEGFEPP